ncbi:TetR/AcrR family transcriptional regulator [Nocardioides alkalitolerans]|uniref:TetR/AcrR family transcriptional regulator n=1 Tax=Nocardioides alkalitolerans TaxID=281714 RepID=UPI00040B93E0|nr:TetR/AcrR family transcriptional regulator [Nocardioides alkalitolerans]
MTHFSPLPMADAPRERSDAARNRDAVMCAAARLVTELGVDAVTMDRVAAEACVGKGTVFRRFGSRAGLMAAVLNGAETEFQERVISGPPPLGPGAGTAERLLAFGPARLRQNLLHGALLEAAASIHGRSHAAYSFNLLHVRHLLAELEVGGDLPLLAAALLSPLEVPVLRSQVEVQHLPVERLEAAWVDLARRVAGL